MTKWQGSVFSQIEKLGPEIMSRIDSKLLSGDSALACVRWLQDELGVIKDVDPSTLKKALERYRESDLRKRTLARIVNATSGSPLKAVSRRLNAMEELGDMVNVQKSRVDKLLMRESSMPVGLLLKDTTNELRLLKDMLVDLGKQQFEVGLLPRAPRTLKGVVETADGSLTQFEWTEEQEQLYKEIEHLEEDRKAGYGDAANDL